MANQFRKCQLTINNPVEKGFSHEEIKSLIGQIKPTVYWCMADEIGNETGTEHTHIYMQFSSPVRFSRIKKLFPQAHIEEAFGSGQENRNYIKKEGKWEKSEKSETVIEGTFEEWGTLPTEPGQGARTDIANVYQMIRDGMSNAEIMESDPDYAAQISKMDKIRLDVLMDKYRKTFRTLDVTYIFGPTETGKTRTVMETCGYENVYRVTEYKHPFDGYNGEDVLLLDEFRSDLKIAEMLNYLDGYPLTLPARYANRVACYTKVYIISNIALEDQYSDVQVDESKTWEALLRRIHHVIEYRTNGDPIDYGSARDYIDSVDLLGDGIELPF